MALNKINSVILFATIGIISYFFTKNMTIILLICIILTILTNLIMSKNILKEGLENKELINPNPNKDVIKENTKNKIADLNETNVISKNLDNPPQPNDNSDSNKISNKKSNTGRIDYASTLEEAYDNLDNILGGTGVKQLTDDTKKLMKQQQELFQSMQNMTPMLNQAQQLLEGFDMKSLGGLANLASSFTNTKKTNPPAN